MPGELILASSSVYRQRLLQRLGLEFRCVAPDADETAAPGESPEALARRLAQAKAAIVAADAPQATVIGSDQVPVLDDQVLGKPGSEARAISQLAACSGRTVVFHTAVCLSSPAGTEHHLEITRVRFRELSAAEIRNYVQRDRPLDSAGAFRSEGLGIALFDGVEGRDPTALIGLPLIWLSGALIRAGYPVL